MSAPWRPIYCAFALVAIVSVAVSCAGHSTKHEPPTPASPPRPLFPADLAWTRDMDEPPAARPTANRTHVFVPLADRVLAFDRETGDTAWAADVATRWALIPVGDALYTLVDDRLVQLDPKAGSVVGQTTLPGTPNGAATRDGDVLIIPLAPASLIAWDIRESRLIWSRPLPAAAQLQPVVNDTTVFVALADGHIAAISLGDGSTKWATELTGTPRAFAASRSVVVVGSSDRTIYALRPATGAFSWPPRRAVSDIVGTAADDRRVYVAALDNTVRAFDATHGAQLWKAVLETRLAVPPQMTPNGLLIGGADSKLTILATATGRTSGTHALPALTILEGAPLVLDDREADRVAVIVSLKDVVDRMMGIKPKPPAPEKPTSEKPSSEKPTSGEAAASTPAAAPAPAPPSP